MEKSESIADNISLKSCYDTPRRPAIEAVDLAPEGGLEPHLDGRVAPLDAATAVARFMGLRSFLLAPRFPQKALHPGLYAAARVCGLRKTMDSGQLIIDNEKRRTAARDVYRSTTQTIQMLDTRCQMLVAEPGRYRSRF